MSFYQQDFQYHQLSIQLNNVDILLGTLTYHLMYYQYIGQDMKNKIYDYSFEDDMVEYIMYNR